MRYIADAAETIGEVSEDVVDQIKKAPKGLKSGKVTDPDWLIAMRVAADLND